MKKFLLDVNDFHGGNFVALMNKKFDNVIEAIPAAFVDPNVLERFTSLELFVSGPIIKSFAYRRSIATAVMGEVIDFVTSLGLHDNISIMVIDALDLLKGHAIGLTKESVEKMINVHIEVFPVLQDRIDQILDEGFIDEDSIRVKFSNAWLMYDRNTNEDSFSLESSVFKTPEDGLTQTLDEDDNDSESLITGLKETAATSELLVKDSDEAIFEISRSSLVFKPEQALNMALTGTVSAAEMSRDDVFVISDHERRVDLNEESESTEEKTISGAPTDGTGASKLNLKLNPSSVNLNAVELLEEDEFLAGDDNSYGNPDNLLKETSEILPSQSFDVSSSGSGHLSLSDDSIRESNSDSQGPAISSDFLENNASIESRPEHSSQNLSDDDVHQSQSVQPSISLELNSQSTVNQDNFTQNSLQNENDLDSDISVISMKKYNVSGPVKVTGSSLQNLEEESKIVYNATTAEEQESIRDAFLPNTSDSDLPVEKSSSLIPAESVNKTEKIKEGDEAMKETFTNPSKAIPTRIRRTVKESYAPSDTGYRELVQNIIRGIDNSLTEVQNKVVTTPDLQNMILSHFDSLLNEVRNIQNHSPKEEHETIMRLAVKISEMSSKNEEMLKLIKEKLEPSQVSEPKVKEETNQVKFTQPVLETSAPKEEVTVKQTASQTQINLNERGVPKRKVYMYTVTDDFPGAEFIPTKGQ